MSVDKTLLMEVMGRFGFSGFRSPEQEQLVMGVANGQDMIGVLPTGAGKSLVFIAPTVVNNWTTVVVSPLIALMDDQVRKLREWGIEAHALHSNLPLEESVKSRLMLRSPPKNGRLVFMSPETALSQNNRSMIEHLNTNLLAIDEAHCVSTWGQDFRPNYLRLMEVGRLLNPSTTIALTATVDPKIMQDIKRRIPLAKGVKTVQMHPFRENLQLSSEILRTSGTARERVLAVKRQIGEWVLQYDGAKIIYCWSRGSCYTYHKHLSHLLQSKGMTPLIYHAGIADAEKREAYDKFVRADQPVVFATSAFGLGIDRPDVRLVMHTDTPHTLIDYAQQIGRAGRDGEMASCHALYNPGRLMGLQNYFDYSTPSLVFVEGVYKRLRRRYVSLKKEGRQKEFNPSAEINRMRSTAEKKIENPADLRLYQQRVNAAFVALQQAAIVFQPDGGHCVVHRLDPSTPKYDKLIEATGMFERRRRREEERLKRFFESINPDQRLLWEIIAEG